MKYAIENIKRQKKKNPKTSFFFVSLNYYSRLQNLKTKTLRKFIFEAFKNERFELFFFKENFNKESCRTFIVKKRKKTNSSKVILISFLLENFSDFHRLLSTADVHKSATPSVSNGPKSVQKKVPENEEAIKIFRQKQIDQYYYFLSFVAEAARWTYHVSTNRNGSSC